MRSVRIALISVIVMLVPGVVHAVLGDIEFQREGDETNEIPPAVFPHWKHRIHYRCYVCHSAIFQMKAGATKITMEEMLQGQTCGACHNGKRAWQVNFDTCPMCHKKVGGNPNN